MTRPRATRPGGSDRQRQTTDGTPRGTGRAVRRALTAAELDRIHAAVEAATSSRELLYRTVRAVYDALLADLGASFDRLPAGQRMINPADFAIPASQLEAIVAAVTNRAGQWGTAAQLALSLVDVMPCGYDDPQAMLPAGDLPDHRPSVHELRVSRAATDVIRACTEHVSALARHYGAGSQIHLRAATSWLAVLSGLFTTGLGATTRVVRDGELSLAVTTSSGIDYGIVFHGDRRRCTHDGCRAAIGDDGTVTADDADPAADNHPHLPSYPLGSPQPGEWTFHS